MGDPVPPDSAYLTAAEAAATLGVKPQTLYAYVSRGWIRSEQAGGGRRRRYLRADVLRLRRRAEVRSNPAAAAHHAFTRSEGSILDSSLTLITEDELYYRGLPATALAGTATFEQVMALLWSGDLHAAVAAPQDASASAVAPEWLRSDGLLLEPWFAFQSVLPRLAAADPAAEDLRPAAVRRTGARILRAELACVAGGSPAAEPPPTGRTAQALAAAWGVTDRALAAALIEPALILLADHELNVSTLAARVAASGRASPYHAVLAGLAAVHGTLHGQASTLVTELLRAVGRPERARGVVGEYLRSRRPLHGFGHRVYRTRDPRAVALMQHLRAAAPGHPALELADALDDAVRDLLVDSPMNVDMALAVLAAVLDLPAGASETLFIVARTAGWIAHALEQYGEGNLLRPRARYVGPEPEETHGAAPAASDAQ